MWRFRDWYRVALIERYAVDVARREAVHLIHSTFAWPSGSAGMLAKQTLGKPLLLSLRGADILTEPSVGYGSRLDGFYDALLRRALRQADRITGNSRYVLEQAQQLGTDGHKCTLVAKRVDIERFSPQVRGDGVQEQLHARGRPIVLSVRHLAPKNGLEHLIRAARLLADKVPEVLVVVCGQGREPYRGQLHALVRDLGLQDHVRLTGLIPRDEIPAYFAACRVSVIPSLMEAAGNVILESMACARPVVGSRVGGIPEYLEDGVSGFLVEPANPAALAERILQLLEDEALAQRMGRAARSWVEEHCRFDGMIEQIEALYHELASLPARVR
jgi:glycosyltransferase involved in cell wall biosynthesis